MNPASSEDDLIQRLEDAAGRLQTGRPVDPVLTGMLADFETIVTEVRQPVATDPCFEEPELAPALQQAVEIGNGSLTEALCGDQQSVVPKPPVAKTTVGQYELLSEIGSGGMGAVFRARHIRLGRIVALKMLQPGRLGSREAIARFDREMRAAGNLHHPNIVAAQDAGEVDGAHFLAMELVDGCDLATMVKSHGPLRIPDACEIVRQAAIGLQHFSDHGVIHRDIKPSNLMLARPATAGATPLVKILDLGLAQFATGEVDPSHDITSTGQVIGTVDFMAPEQGLGRGSPLDIRADLYSLGATLFKLISGRAPFESPQFNTILKRLQALENAAPPSLSDVVPGCPAELSALVARLLSKSPEDRPTSPNELVRELTPFAQGADLNAILKHVPSLQSKVLSETITKTFQRDTTNDTLSKPSAQSVPKPPVRRRWPLAVAAVGLVAILVAVIVVVTDTATITINVPDELVEKVSVNFLRDGRQSDTWLLTRTATQHTIYSGRVEVRLPSDVTDEFELRPEGEITLRRGDRRVVTLVRRKPAVENVTTPQSAKPLPHIANTGSPRNFEEAPPLHEWLKGRTILSVAQNGTSQFKTIQDALNALQPGQVVQVMDAGPYRERLELEFTPADTGLVSRRGTLIELPQWKDDGLGTETPGRATHGHRFNSVSGFRLSGFRFTCPARKGFGAVTHWRSPTGLVIDDCDFQPPHLGDTSQTHPIIVNLSEVEPSPKPIVIRRCQFHFGHLEFYGSDRGGMVHVYQNYFTDTGHAYFAIRRLKQFVFCENVCEFAKGSVHLTGLEGNPADVQILNNTLAGPILMGGEVPERGAIIQNNILRGIRPKANEPALEAKWKTLIEDQWLVGNNFVLSTPLEPFYQLQSKQGNLSRVEFLSLNSTNINYLRFSNESPLATQGVGGKLPSYQGAFTPGGMPLGGNWFSRMRVKWPQKNQPGGLPDVAAPPTPPQLNDLLKGRKILTVAQDGSGQFKTIQAALDALQPGETVKVLDKGPYRERLEAFTLPQDCGVISEVETILDVPEWKFNYTHKDAATGAETPVLAAHMFSGANAFRLHGFEMRFPPSDGQMVRRIAMSHTRDVVLEHCYIRASESFEGEPVDIGDWNAGDGVGMKAWMRECIIEGSVTFTAHYKGPDIPERRSSLVVERNYFLGVGTEHHLMISGPAMKNLAIRHNVFAGNATRDILMGQVVAPTSLEVSNNSLLSQNGITFSGGIPQASVTIRNNLHSRFGIVSIVGDDGAALRAAAQRWNIDHNAYPDLTGGNAVSSVLPPQPADIAILPRYLSKVPQEADYLRIAADDQLATAGAGGQRPTYLGALPPAPAPADGDWFTRIRERWITSDKSK